MGLGLPGCRCSVGGRRGLRDFAHPRGQLLSPPGSCQGGCDTPSRSAPSGEAWKLLPGPGDLASGGGGCARPISHQEMKGLGLASQEGRLSCPGATDEGLCQQRLFHLPAGLSRRGRELRCELFSPTAAPGVQHRAAQCARRPHLPAGRVLRPQARWEAAQPAPTLDSNGTTQAGAGTRGQPGSVGSRGQTGHPKTKAAPGCSPHPTRAGAGAHCWWHGSPKPTRRPGYGRSPLYLMSLAPPTNSPPWETMTLLPHFGFDTRKAVAS